MTSSSCSSPARRPYDTSRERFAPRTLPPCVRCTAREFTPVARAAHDSLFRCGGCGDVYSARHSLAHLRSAAGEGAEAAPLAVTDESVVHLIVQAFTSPRGVGSSVYLAVPLTEARIEALEAVLAERYQALRVQGRELGVDRRPGWVRAAVLEGGRVWREGPRGRDGDGEPDPRPHRPAGLERPPMLGAGHLPYWAGVDNPAFGPFRLLDAMLQARGVEPAMTNHALRRTDELDPGVWADAPTVSLRLQFRSDFLEFVIEEPYQHAFDAERHVCPVRGSTLTAARLLAADHDPERYAAVFERAMRTAYASGGLMAQRQLELFARASGACRRRVGRAGLRGWLEDADERVRRIGLAALTMTDG